MIFRVCNNTYRFFTTVISKTKIMNNNKCYFRFSPQEEKLDISFLLDVKGTVRQFNLSRNPSETLQVLLARIKTNVQKIVNKKNKKKKGGENDEDIPISVMNVKNDTIDGHFTCKDLLQNGDPVRLKILDNEFDIIFNAPWVLSINLPQSILAGFPVYPEYFELQHADINQCTFNWYRGLTISEKGNHVSEQHVKWELVGNTYSYIPKIKDIGMKLKLECIPGNDGLTGPAVETISKDTIAAGPGNCPFETRHMFTKIKLTDRSFRCVSYNILADLYCDSEYTRTILHPYCPPYALHIDYRKQLIIKELLGYNSDIICLQEVDTKIFRNCLTPILETEGLEGKFFRKGKEVAEGLACFYRKDRFRYIGEEKILLSEAVQTKPCLQPIWDVIKNNSPLKERLLNRSTIASVTFLQSIDSPSEMFMVANTHLYFHPDADHIRLTQGGIIIYWLMDIRKEIASKFSDKRISLILCGDFNSVPSCGIYQLYTKGASPSTLPDWKSNLNEAVNDLSLQQNISLDSACGTPPYTNYTAEFADCLDYIFYEKSNIVVEQVVPLPSVDELRLHTALPSVVFPSDHLALVADFRFK